MHGYTSKKDLQKLVLNHRIAYVICDVKTKDIDEYINIAIQSLGAIGFDVHMLTMCNIFKENGLYNIVLTLRSKVEPCSINTKALNVWARNMGNVKDAQTYLKESYKDDKVILLKCKCKTLDKKRYTSNIKIDLDSVGNAKNINIDYRGDSFKIKVLNNTDKSTVITSAIHEFFGIIWRKNKTIIERVDVNVDGETYNYDVTLTSNGLKLHKV